MAVPKFFEFFEGFLCAVQDGELHTAKEVREIIAKKMNLTDEDRKEMLPSGKQRTFDNRVAWARTYLDKAAYTYGKHFLEQGEKEAARYFLGILYELTQDEQVKEMLSPDYSPEDKA